MISRQTVMETLDDWLEPQLIKDYCPNGLQVEGCESIERVVVGVTASRALLEAAVAKGAQAVIVHHGLYWKGDDPRCVGLLRGRLLPLIQHNVNLFAYHLPLDIHVSLGNNAQLAEKLNWSVDESFSVDGIPNLLWLGRDESRNTLADIVSALRITLGQAPLVLGPEPKRIARIAWCTGGAQRYLPQAKAAGADLFVTGEASEQTHHMAHELNITCIAAGHHATERYGVQALGDRLAKQFDLICEYVEIENPV
ncbi:MAG: Nif3-like dinuclear metal center hexameric protein [Gammaproteobacteria bacterium]